MKPFYVRLRRCKPLSEIIQESEEYEWLFGESETEATQTKVSRKEVQNWIDQLHGPDDYIEVVTGNFTTNAASRARLAEYLEMVLDGTEI